MQTDEQLQTEFKGRLAETLKDLKENGQKDPEVLWLIGSLANEITQRGKKDHWPELKAALAPEAYNDLLEQFREQGTNLKSNGNIKAAYAVQAVATSLVASRLDDADIAVGNELMDAFIMQAVKFFKSAEAANTNPN